ncbi:MAG TPA: hypothetical protein VNH39_08085, partial [Steroidobacteraceae bacterium]|nr:hypothetical protein [Steroidobacteraceae bacterium]
RQVFGHDLAVCRQASQNQFFALSGQHGLYTSTGFKKGARIAVPYEPLNNQLAKRSSPLYDCTMLHEITRCRTIIP